MAASKGRDFTIKISTDSGSTYTTVGKTRNLSMSYNNEMVDITNKDSAGIRELLENAGVRSVTVTFDGVTDNADAGLAQLESHVQLNTHAFIQLQEDGSGGTTYTGRFGVSSFTKDSSFNNEVPFNCTLESSGAITIA